MTTINLTLVIVDRYHSYCGPLFLKGIVNLTLVIVESLIPKGISDLSCKMTEVIPLVVRRVLGYQRMIRIRKS
jgi:hypothetical protein